MSAAGRDVLPIFMFCLCQLVTGVYTQASSGRGNSFSGSQKQIPIDVKDQRYDVDNSADAVARSLDAVEYLVPLAGSKDKQKNGGKTLFSGHRDSQVIGGKPAITSSSNRNMDIEDVAVPEGGRRRQVSTSALSAYSTSHLTPRPPETSSPTSWSAGPPGVSAKRLNINLEQSNDRGSSLETPFVRSSSWTESNGASSKAPYMNVLELLDANVRYVNETDLIISVIDSDSINFVNETDLVNETETLANNHQENNITVLRPVTESSLQLSHTKIVVTSQQDKAIRRNAGYVEDSRQSNTKPTPTALDHHPLSRQPITNNTSMVLDPRPVSGQPITNNTSMVLNPRPVSRQPITNNTSMVLDLRPVSRQPITNNTAATLDPRPVSRQPITNNTSATLEPRPISRQPITNNTAATPDPRSVSRHNSWSSTPAEPSEFPDIAWEGDSSASKRKAASAEPATEAGLSDAQTENDGELDEDSEEEDSNDTSTCTTCNKGRLTEEHVKKIRIGMFKELLAQKMRIELNESSMQGALNDATAPARPPKLPQVILEQTIKDNVEESEKDQFYARDQEIIIAGHDLARDCPRPEVTGCYRFHIKDKVKQSVAGVKLWFYKLKDVNDVKGQTFKIIDLNINYRRPQGHVIAVKHDVFSNEGWVQMDVTGEMHKWLNTGRTSPILAIRCSTCRAKSYTSVFGIKQGYKPLLAVKYASHNQVSRGKRSGPCDPVSECCKRDLVIRFHDIHMPEVYEPRNLSIGYCFGSCVETHQFTYNHTILKNRYRLNGSRGRPTMNQQLMSCCVPLVLKDTFLMTIEDNNYVRKVVPKVIVETCGCM